MPLSEYDNRPWERPGAFRRDCLPHRGPLLMVLANISLICGVLTWCLLFPCYVGLPLGLIAYLAAKEDLILMRRGEVDRDGWGQTHAAWSRSIDALILNIPGWCMTVLAFLRVTAWL